MKKLLFISTLIVFTIFAAQAQIKTRTERTKLQAPLKISEPVPTERKTPQPPPPSTNKSSDTGTSDPLVYTLTSVRVRIKTGNDNKEFPSKVYVWIKAKNQASWSPFYQDKLDNEMKVSSETEFGLDFKSWAG